MFSKAIDIILSTTHECLNRTMEAQRNIESPNRLQVLMEFRWQVTAVCMSALAYNKLSPIKKPPRRKTKASTVLSELSVILGPNNNFLKKSPEFLPSINSLLDNAVNSLISLDLQEFNLSDLYEILMTYEYCLHDNGIEIDDSKVPRHNLGCYYTPLPLAQSCVELAIDQYIYQQIGVKDFSRLNDHRRSNCIEEVLNLLGNAKILDPSCGVGRFLIAYVAYIKKYIDPIRTKKHKTKYTNLLLCLHGFDIDPIALQISRIELALAFGDQELIKQLEGNFSQVNTLLKSYNNVSFEKKRKLFQSGFIYHQDLGAGKDLYEKAWDIVVGNPPWEKIRLDERRFFRHLAHDISNMTRKDSRQKAINGLKSKKPDIYSYYSEFNAQINSSRESIKKDERFGYASQGELNSYALFTAYALSVTSQNNGVVGLLVKTGLFTTACYSDMFRDIVHNKRLVAVFDFINKNKIFPIDGRERFCLLLAGKGDGNINFVMGLTEINQLFEKESLISVTPNTLKKLNPQTGMLINVKDKHAFNTISDIFEKNALFNDMYPEANFGRIVHLTTHTDHIFKQRKKNLIPIYEGKFIEQYDGRFAGFDGVPKNMRYLGKAYAKQIDEQIKECPDKTPECRFFIKREVWDKLSRGYQEKWSLMWRNTTSVSNRRTCIATILPHMPTLQSIQFFQLPGSSPRDLSIILATMNSLVFDYILRKKLNGIDVTQTIIKQMAIPSNDSWKTQISFCGKRASLETHILKRVRSLLSNDNRLSDFCKELPNNLNATLDTRREIQRELDILVARAYQIKKSLFAQICRDFEKDLFAEEISLMLKQF